MRSASQATEEYPYPRPANLATKGCETRPALTDEEARSLTNDELVRRGYSPRPILPSGQICSHWLRAVKRPMTHLEPITIPRRITRRKHPHTMTSRTAVALAISEMSAWCGIETRNRATSYQFVTGVWTMPQMPLNTSISYGEMAIWVGFDGYGTADVVQSGTNYEVWPMTMLGGSPWVFVYAHPWAEVFPAAATWQSIVPFVGDQIRVAVWIDENGSPGSPSIPNRYAHMETTNLTALSYSDTVVPVNGLGISATEAEWIVEATARLADDGVTLIQMPLAQFANFEILAAFCERRGDSTVRGWSEENDKRLIWMFKNNRILSLCSPEAPWQMRFVWWDAQ